MNVDATEPLRVFLVEDHSDTLNTLFVYLHKMGYRVRTAGTFAEAVRKISEEPTDVLICDVGLPDGSGWDLVSHVDPSIFAIAITGLSSPADRLRSQERGFREHLTKPFFLEKLQQFLDTAANERLQKRSPVIEPEASIGLK